MAEFSETEIKLIDNYIKDGNLRTSLGLIRESMEKLWREDTPRIVRNFTDHGNNHCKRLVDYVDKLLEANSGRKLAEYEMFLLLAGIYLHDIGMQCDVVKFPQIKEQAVKLKAEFETQITELTVITEVEFETDFTAEFAGDYSIQEQNLIRNNHQYLSAAWISYAFRTGDTLLGPALKTVPYKLILDLMDVCKFHSKLPITKCGDNFTLFPEFRKKLVAVLLRFSDELDIDSNRVLFEVIKNFSFDPHNSLYWWLHNLTTVSFSDKNHILLKVALNPEDIKNYSSQIQQEYIESFKSKNQVLLDHLSRDGIIIVIDSNSKVEEYEFSERLPVEIKAILDNMQKNEDPLESLVNEVKMWLRIIKYEVTESSRFDDKTVNFKAVNPFKQNLLVRCIGGEISEKDVNNLDMVLDRKTPQGWLVSDRRVSQNARLRASKDDSLEVFTLNEFLRQKVWGQYFDTLKSLVEKEQIPKLYVDIGCYKERLEGGTPKKEEYSSLDDYIDEWLAERGKTHISLLGEFGTGKTWFSKHYAYLQLNRYLKDPAKQRLPLLITLRDFVKATTVQQLINDALLEQYKLPFVGSAFDAFKEMNRQGKLLLILDGFDEMARQVDYQTVVDNFWELAKLVEENSKIILTSRNEYFRWAEESEKIFAGKEFGRRTLVLAPPKFEVLYLKQLNDDQIKKIINNKKGIREGTIIAEHLLNNENLAAMARKPVLIELLLASLEEVSDKGLENPAQIYLFATNKLLLRNIETGRTFTSTADKLFFLCELAWEMIRNNELKVHYSEIPERISYYFKSKIKDRHELDTWDFDLRNQTLLHRNAAGYYEFAHKSLAEYFVAFKFASELKILNPLYKKTYCEADGSYCLLPVKSRKIVDLRETFGYFPLKSFQIKATFDLLCEMITEKANKKLWKIIEFTRNKTFEDVKYLGGNAATLLLENKGSFAGANLENTVLEYAYLRKSNLLTSNVCGCDLVCADLTGSRFDEKILNAKLGENKLLVHVKSTKRFENKNFNKKDKDIAELSHDIVTRYKLGKLIMAFVDRISKNEEENTIKLNTEVSAYLFLVECNIFNILEAKEKIFKDYSIEFNIYLEEDHPFEQYFEQLKTHGIDIHL